MTELSAAVALAQLRHVDRHVEAREQLARHLTNGAADLAGIIPPRVREGCRHNYYCWTARYDAATVGISRATFSKALAAEGFPNACGYVRPLYLLPLFQRQIAIGRAGFPFSLGAPAYDRGLCPVAERLYEHEAILFEPCAYAIDQDLRPLLAGAIAKVHRNVAELAAHERGNRN